MGPINNLGNLAAPGPSDTGSSGRKADVPRGEDQAQLATVPLSAQVQEIHRTDPSSFQAVLSDAIRKLRAAAAESSDPAEAAYLSGLANGFQRLVEANSASTQINSAGNT
jgi:hypothetical protein